MQAFLDWNGWGFLGFLTTVVGSVLSVLFAYRASRNAKSAQAAAISAKQTIASVDAVSEIGRIQSLLREIRLRLEKSDWDRISEICEDIQKTATVIQKTSSIEVSEEGEDTLSKLLTQTSTISSVMNKASHSSGNVDPVKIKRILSTVAQQLSALQVEVKEKLDTKDE